MQKVVRADFEGSFCGSDARPCGGVERLPHGIRFAVAALDGLAEDFQHADIPVTLVRVDDVCHPFEELVRALVLVVNVEAWRRSILEVGQLLSVSTSLCQTYLSGICILSNLGSRRTMQINNDIKSCVARPSTDLLQVVESPLRKMFAVRIHQIFTDPVSNRNPNSIQAVRPHLRDILLGGPGVPMRCPSLVGLSLTKLTDAIELGCRTAATHAVPLITGHPGLDDELRAEIDSTEWQGGRKPSHGLILVPSWHDGSLVLVNATAQKRMGPRGHPCRREACRDRDCKGERPHR